MNIISLNYKERRNNYHIELSQSGNSDAIEAPLKFVPLTVLLSSVVGGTAKVQYSLSTKDKVLICKKKKS